MSAAQAKQKATAEYKRYKAKTLSPVEKAYLKSLSALEKKAKKGSRKNEPCGFLEKLLFASFGGAPVRAGWLGDVAGVG